MPGTSRCPSGAFCGRINAHSSYPSEGSAPATRNGTTAAILAAAAARLAPLGPEAWNWQVAAYLAVVAALPFVVWRWLHPSLDFIVGVFLICQAALAAGGVTYSLVGVALVFPPVAVVMIAVGVREHRRFRELDARLAAARGAR